jgi:hypothetical protein
MTKMKQTENKYLESLQPETEMENLYRSGAIFDADSGEIIQFLKHLGTKALLNEGLQHAWIIRGITANAILMRRYMESVEKRNGILKLACDPTGYDPNSLLHSALVADEKGETNLSSPFFAK